MVGRVRGSHGIDVIGDPLCLIGRECPPRKDAGESGDDCLIVSRNRLARRIFQQRPIRIQTVQADGKELQDFTRIVFIRIRLLVVGHVQIVAHGGIQRDLVQQLSEVSERVAIQGLQVWSESARLSLSDSHA